MNANPDSKTSLMRQSKAELADEILALQQDRPNPGSPIGELNSVLETIDYGILLLGPDLRTHVANHAMREMWGLSADFIATHPALEDVMRQSNLSGAFDVAGVGLEKVIEIWVERIRTGAIEPRELTRSDGAIFHFQLKTLDDGGRMLTFYDITDRKHAEDALLALKNQAAAAEALLEDAFDNISDGFVLYDVDDRLVMCNDKFREMYDFSDDDIHPGTSWMDLHKVSLARGTNEWESVSEVARSKRRRDDFERRLSNGHWIDIRQRRTKTGNFVAIHVDITERRRAEEALRQSQAITNEAVKIAHLGHWTYDVVNRSTTYCSEEYARIYGYSEEKYSAMAKAGNFGFLNIHPDDESRVLQVYNDSLSTQTHWNIEYRIVRTDGSVGHVREIGELVRDDSGKFVQTLGTIQDISERVRVLQTLEEARNQAAAAEALLEDAIDNVSDGFVLYDANDKLVMYNNMFADIYGFTDDHFGPETTWMDLQRLNTERGNIVWESDSEVAPGERRWDDFERRLADGRWVDIRQRRTKTGNLVSIHTDVSQHMRTEEALRESREQYALAMRSTNEVIYDVDLATGAVRFSSGIRKDLGLPEQADSDEPWSELIHPDFIDLYHQANADLITGKTGHLDNEYLIRNVHGDWRWVRQQGIVLRAENGQAYRLIGSTGDITERKKAEEALVEKEHMLRMAINHMPGSFYMVDKDYRIQVFNDKFPEIAKLDPAKVYAGAYLDDIMMDRAIAGDFGPGDPKEIMQRLKKMYQAQDYSLMKNPTQDGRIIEITRTPTENGGTVVMSKDITEQKRAEEVLRNAKEAAEAATEAKSEFVATVSHEVRTPMNGVLGMARLLLETPLSREQQEFAQNVVSSGEALLTILNDLLDISKLEAGKLEFETVPFDVNQLMADSVALMAPNAREKGLDLTSEVSRDLPNVLLGDANRIRQILFNLISNAIKFTNDGHVSVGTSGTVDADGMCAFQISVTDTGVGLTKKDAELLFAPYVQASVDVARKYGGTGLGLAISRHLAELMGGQIYLESRRGKGSTFTLTLMLGIGGEGDVVVSLPGVGAQAAGGGLELAFAPRVLLVDDNEMNRKVAVGIVRKFASETVVARNGQEALALIDEAGPFDVVLMDRHMPVMDGVEATQKLRAMADDISQVPVIGLTAAATRDEIDQCLEAGMNEVVIKPIDPVLLKNVIGRLIAAAPDARERAAAASAVKAGQGGGDVDDDDDDEVTLDQNALQELGEDHGPAAILDFIETFEDIAPKAVENFSEAADLNDLPAMAFHAHDLKNSARIVGLMKLSTRCRELEVACKDGTANDYKNLARDLVDLLNEGLKALKDFLEQAPQDSADLSTKYLARVAHDMRGTISRALGFVALMEEGIDQAVPASEFELHANGIRLEGQRMIEVVAEVLQGLQNDGGINVPQSSSSTTLEGGISQLSSVLLVEDDITLARTLADYLSRQDLEVVSVTTGKDMFRELDSRGFDCFVVDLTLPDEDGIVLIRKLRARLDTPIIVQTGRGDIDDKIAAFDLGANEYVTKPVDPRELAVRIKTLVKHTAQASGLSDSILRFGDFTLEQGRHEAAGPNGDIVKFTTSEFALIWALVNAGGKILSRDTLVDAIATGDGPESSRAVDILVTRVRKKLGKDAIESVYGEGYRCNWDVSPNI